MPWFSYHGGHSGEYCRHAKGSLEAVVEQAWQAGFTHYGLSEHCPRYRTEDLFEDEADLGVAGVERAFGAFCAEARRLQEVFSGRIEILVGFETERLPPDRWAEAMKELRASTQADYIIGSVHHVAAQCIDYTQERTAAIAHEVGGRVALERAYFDDLAELVEALGPEVVGHFDLIRKFDGDDFRFGAEVWPHIERALDAVHAAGAVLDVNSGAYRRGLSPVYPQAEILERARAMGIGVTLGDDSHGPHDVGVGLDASMRAIEAAGYEEVAYFGKRDGAVTRFAAPIGKTRPLARPKGSAR